MPVEIKEVVIKVPNSDFRVDVVCQDLASELKLERGTATERLGALFEITLSLYSDDLDIDLCAVLGKPMAIHISTAGGERWFHGVVAHFAMTGMTDRHGFYTAILRPKLALMGEATTSRVYATKSLAEIVQDSLQRAAVDVGGVSSSPSVQFEHCVQYRESDLAFVSRLLERYGFFYWHRHAESKHTLEVAFGTTGLPDLGTFDHAFDGAGTSDHQISDWRFTKSLRTSSYRVAGTEYLTTAGIDAKQQTRFGIQAASALKVHDFEAVNDSEKPHLEELATARMQAIDTTVEDYRGTTDSLAMAVGGLFTLAGHPRADQNKQYLCVAATYQFQGIKPDGTRDPGRPYLVQFSAIDSQTPFSPPIVHQKPVVQGPHLARVVEETDENGRVLVAFHWGNPDEDLQSCRARVSQNWAGKEWGGVFLPHVDHEVIVEFLNGDPDQPIVTGRVYNQESMPPLALPGEKQSSIIRDHGGNELRMDGGDPQKVRLFSPKENSEIVLGGGVTSHSYRGDGDWLVDFKGKQTEDIGKDKKVTVKGNVIRQTDGNHDELVKKDYLLEVLGNYKLKVKKDWHENILGRTSKFILGWKQESIVGSETKTITGNKTEITNALKINRGATKEILKFKDIFQKAGITKTEAKDWWLDSKDVLVTSEKIDIDAKKSLVLKTGEGATLEAKGFKSAKVDADEITMTAKGDLKLQCKDLYLDGDTIVTAADTLVDFCGVFTIKP